MKILYISLNDYQDKWICEAFRGEGVELQWFSFPEKTAANDFVILSEQNRYALALTLQQRGYDMVFSLSYLHEVSVFCNMLGVIYLSWTVDYPAWDLYRESVKNPCNCFFISNPKEVSRLQKLGVENVFLLPAAAAPVPVAQETEKRVIEPLQAGEEVTEKEVIEPLQAGEEGEYEVSFIGRMKESQPQSPFADIRNLSPECRGYLDGLTHCQRITYGYDVLQYGVPTYVMKELQEKYPLEVPGDVSGGMWNMYVKKYMLDRISYQERRVLFRQIEKSLTTFTGMVPEEEIPYTVQPLPQTWEEFCKITDQSKVNLCIIDRQYEDAVPRYLFEMMARGNFVLCNHHLGMEKIWEAGEAFAAFEDAEDLDMKLRIYLSNEERRREMQSEAKKITEREHLLQHRIRKILEILG